MTVLQMTWQYYWPNRYMDWNRNGRYLVDKSTLRPIRPTNSRPTNSRPINESLALAISSMIENNMTLSSYHHLTQSLINHSLTHHAIITCHHYPLTHHTPENPYSKEYKARSKQWASKLSLMHSVTKQSSLSNCPHHHLCPPSWHGHCRHLHLRVWLCPCQRAS